MSGEYGTELGDVIQRDVSEVAHDFDPVYDIECFHRRFQQLYTGKPRMLPHALQSFRTKFLQEELVEYEAAVSTMRTMDYNQKDSADALDSLVDLVYVALGTAHLHGYDFREAWRRVHRANMAKVIAQAEGDARSHRDARFDVVKPAGWKAPNHTDLV